MPEDKTPPTMMLTGTPSAAGRVPVRAAGWEKLPLNQEQGKEIIELLKRNERLQQAQVVLLKSIAQNQEKLLQKR